MTGEGALPVRINKINSKAFERVSSRGELEGVAADSSRLINERGGEKYRGYWGRGELEIRNGGVLFPIFFFFTRAGYKSAADTVISLLSLSMRTPLVIRDQKLERACFETKGKGRGYGAWSR